MNRKKIIILALLGMVPLAAILSSSIGAFQIDFLQGVEILLNKVGIDTEIEFTGAQENVFLFIRLPRVVLAVLVGAGLAIAGVAMQGLFRNPLADPGLIGISSGAAMAAALFIILGLNSASGIFALYGLAISAFVGAIISTLIVFTLAKSNGKTNVSTMLLAGIAVNALASSITGFMMYLSAEDQLRSISFWTLGSLGSANWFMVLTLLPLIIGPILMIPRLSKQIDAFSLGEAEAYCLGVKTQRLKQYLIIWVALAVGASVAFVGVIGFIGLTIPHISRLLLGAGHKYLFIGSALLGAIVLTISDLLCRTVLAPSEVPIGILTALMGTPIFISLLLKQKSKQAGYV